MGFIVFVLSLYLLSLLALRYGHDSRSRLHSREEDLAVGGMTWEAPQLRPAGVESGISVH